MINLRFNLVVFILVAFCAFGCDEDWDKKVSVDFQSFKEDSIKERNIRMEIVDYIRNNQDSPIISNFLKLANDSNAIKKYREFIPADFYSNIHISVGKESAQISPIPVFYNIEEGKYGEYLVYRDTLGQLKSYILNFNLGHNLKVKNCKAFVVFKNDSTDIIWKKDFLEKENFKLLDSAYSE